MKRRPMEDDGDGDWPGSTFAGGLLVALVMWAAIFGLIVLLR
jgi:hypothetical protein